MSNQSDEVLIENKPNTSKHIHWGNIGILFSTLAVIVCIATAGYGYVELSHATTSLAEALVSQQTSLSNTQQSVAQLQKASQVSTQQEQVVNELYSRLISLDNSLDQLPLPISMNSTQVAAPSTVSETPVATLSWWREALARSWEMLSKIVVVRYIGKNELPITAPEEKVFLYQNLHAQMQSAIWALLHHNGNVYQNSLERAKTWIQRYFIQDAVETKNALQELEELQLKTVSTP